MKHYQIEENKNIMQSPFIKSLPLSYGIGFFKFLKDIIMHLLRIKCLKIHFLNGFANKNSKILNGLKFNCFISFPFTTKNYNKKFNP
jgi:hypothetical protein